MEITKRLLLNKTPKNVPNGALTCAKNIIIDDTSSFITNEPGLTSAFECNNEGEFIVGVIPCNEEIVIFTFNKSDNSSHIYRKPDNAASYEVASDWKYSGGTITGTFTYNYKGELIIVVGEYGAKEFKNGQIQDKNIPLKCWNLDKNYNGSTYNISDDIDEYICNYNIIDGGNLLCGTYTFFIRFAIDDYNYSKWFQITDDIFIYNILEKEKPNHTYTLDGILTKLEFNTDKGNYFARFEINGNDISALGISLKISNITRDKFQIGYIYKRESETVGRILNTFTNNVSVINMINNDYLEETSIDDLLENPTQYYNVKNIINYNNRIYIANYKEDANENLTNKAREIGISTISTTDIKPATQSIANESTNIELHSADGSINVTENNIEYYEENGNYYINNPASFIRNYIINNLQLKDVSGNPISIIDDNRVEIGNGDPEDLTAVEYEIHTFSFIVSTPGYNGDSTYFTSLYDSHSKTTNVKLRLDFNSNKIYIEWNDISNRSIEINNDSTEPKCYFNIGINARQYNIFGHQIGREYSYYIFGGDGSDPNDDRSPKPGPLWRPRSGVPLYGSSNKEQTNIYISYTLPANCNRTFIPLQKYNIFVHYIRKNGSYTNGYLHSSITTPIYDNLRRITINVTPRFLDDDKYIGFFLSYEAVEINATPAYIYDAVQQSSGPQYIHKCKLTNTDYLYGGNNIVGNSFRLLSRNGSFKMLSIENIKRTTIERHKEFMFMANQSEAGGNPEVGIGLSITGMDDTLYTKSIKTLYRLTPNFYKDHQEAINIDSFRFHPSFIGKEKIIYFDKDLIMNPTSSVVLNDEGDEVKYKVGFGNPNEEEDVWNYSLTPLNCYSLKQDYNKGAVSLIDKEGRSLGVYYNSIIQPDKLHDLLEIQAAYTSVPNKTFTNYRDDAIDSFDKTIRRSDVFSDESLTNNFRNFRVDNYKNIFENKGKITNIIGIGLYFLVHTEYSIFVFDRSNRLNAKAQLEIPDTFDVDYQELLPSNEGFGGLIDKEESIITKNGYIWLDKTNKYIFIYIDGKINILSNDINNLLESIDIKTIRFAEDIKRNRLLICIYDVNNNAITISYNFNSNTFISLHDYTFTNNYKTYNVSYLFDINKDRKRLYVFDNNSNSFGNLTINNDIYYPQYK